MQPFLVLWDTTGLSTFLFPRASIPSDIANDAPLPSTWGTPVARFPASACNPYEFFVNQSIIFDTTLWSAPLLHSGLFLSLRFIASSSGNWAGTSAAWNMAGSAEPGASCASSTGVSTCQAFVQNHGAAFAQACKYHWVCQTRDRY